MKLSISPRRIATRRIAGRFPAWLWREYSTASRESYGLIPVLIVDDGSRPLVVLDIDDYNALVSTPAPIEPEETP